MTTPNILGLASSPRSRQYIYKALEECKKIKSDEEFLYFFEKINRDKKVSNSDACLLASLYGVLKNDCNPEIISLRDIKNESKNILMTKLAQANGILASTPVYFGDSTNLLKDFFRQYSDYISGKIFAITSVGAKRNGGQETTNIFSLYRALMSNTMVVGNGPKTSQYGGTAWAGDIGAIREDNIGIETSMEVGSNIARASKLFLETNIEETYIKIVILVDDKYISNQFSKIKKLSKYIDIVFIDIRDYNINSCIACSVCPNPKTTDKYKCIIKDDFELLDNDLLTSDLLIKATSNIKMDIFLERMRHIRRDDFRLAYIPFLGYYTYPALDMLNDLTTFIRHNMIIMPPVYDIKELSNDFMFFDIIKMIKENRIKNNFNHKYESIGYKK